MCIHIANQVQIFTRPYTEFAINIRKQFVNLNVNDIYHFLQIAAKLQPLSPVNIAQLIEYNINVIKYCRLHLHDELNAFTNICKSVSFLQAKMCEDYDKIPTICIDTPVPIMFVDLPLETI